MADFMPFSLIATQAAKETETLTAEQHARESIRIARTTRELLKKFAVFSEKLHGILVFEMVAAEI